MPCAKPMRGKTDTKLPPVGQHDPCGLPIVSSVGGTSVAAQNLCLGHFAMANGYLALVPPIVQS